MEWNEILALMEQGEGQSLEFEKSITTEEDIARELVAFSNTNGGKLVFGIDDKSKHFIGVEVNEAFRDWVTRIATERCSPTIKVEIDVIERHDRHVIALTIPEGDEKPYRTDDICYIRDGSESRPATEHEEKEISSPWSDLTINKRQKKALHYMIDHQTITNREYRNLFGVSHKTAHIELTMLANRGILASEGLGRSTCYILKQNAHELINTSPSPTLLTASPPLPPL